MSELCNLDLNLLVALDALLTERSVTGAARRLGLSQPSLSGSLARLRRHFGDELLTRAGNRYELTALGAQLRPLVRATVSGAARVFASASRFEPEHAEREFQLLAMDYMVAVFGPVLSVGIARVAPRVRLRLVPFGTALLDRPDDALRTVDGAFLPPGVLTGYPHLDVLTEEWVCVASTDHALTVDDLAIRPWVVVQGTTETLTDETNIPALRQLAMAGVEPRAEVITGSFLAVPELVSGTDRVALLQRRLAARLRPELGLHVLACPVPLLPLRQAFWWHSGHEGDAGHRWLRQRIVETAAQLAV